MKKVQKKSDKADIRDEYDFSRGVRGKYARRYAAGNTPVRSNLTSPPTR